MWSQRRTSYFPQINSMINNSLSFSTENGTTNQYTGIGLDVHSISINLLVGPSLSKEHEMEHILKIFNRVWLCKKATLQNNRKTDLQLKCLAGVLDNFVLLTLTYGCLWYYSPMDCNPASLGILGGPCLILCLTTCSGAKQEVALTCSFLWCYPHIKEWNVL